MKIKVFLLVISLVLLSSCLKRKIRTINNKERKEEVNLADSNDKNSDFYIEFGRLKYKGILDYIEVFKSKSIGNPDYRVLLKQEIGTTSGGAPTSSFRVVIGTNGNVITAFPF